MGETNAGGLTRAGLLDAVEGVSVPARQAGLARVARRWAGTPEFGRLLGELSAGDWYERSTAVHLAVIAGDRGFLTTQLDAPEPDLRVRALTSLTALGVEPAVMVELLPGLSHRARKLLCRSVGRRGRHDLADALAGPVREHYGDLEAARLLAHCSPGVVAELLPDLGYAVPSRSVLCRRHHAVVFDYVEGQLPGADAGAVRELWAWAAANPEVAADHHPGRLLAVAAEAVRHVRLDLLVPVAGQLARRDPAAMYALITHHTGNGRCLRGRKLWRALQVLPDSQLRELYAGAAPRDRAQLLHATPPARRATIAADLLTRPGIEPANLDYVALEELPRPARAAAARELLSRPGFDVPGHAGRLAARLPWAQALPILTEITHRPEADERAAGYRLLITAAAGSRDPEVVTELLGLLTRLRNEQDPVRSNALHALADLPPTLLTPAAVPGLERAAADALRARDCSPQSAAAVGRLIRILLLRAAQLGDSSMTEAALRTLTLAAEHNAAPNLAGLQRNLARGAEFALYEALRPRLEADAARDRWDLALALADGLGKRAYAIAGLQRIVLRACASRADHTVRRAVRLALRAPAARDAHLDEMLNRDPSLIVLPEVQWLIARRRTDLLDALLTTPAQGRFLAPQVRLVPLLDGGFRWWTAQQVDMYANLLTAHASAPHTSPGERAVTVRRLGLLPGSIDRVAAFTEDAELSVAEAALTALGNSDEPGRAIAVLAGFTDGDRARVAVFGIGACARAIEPARLEQTLAPLLQARKVTAVKEGLRLVAQLRVPEPMRIVRTLWDRPGAHRDIRRAAVFAACRLLDHEPAWDLLPEAVTDLEIASAVLTTYPWMLPEEHRPRFASLLREPAAAPDPRVAAAAIGTLGSWVRWWAPGTAEVVASRLTDLGAHGVWRAAISTLLSQLSATGDGTTVLAVVERLQAADDIVTGRDVPTGERPPAPSVVPDLPVGQRSAVPPADGDVPQGERPAGDVPGRQRSDPTLSIDQGPDRDLPARQRLAAFLQALRSAARIHDLARPVAIAAAGLLRPDPLWHGEVIELTVSAIRWTEPEGAVDAIAGLAPLATGALTELPARALDETLRAALTRTPPESLRHIAAGLAAAPDPSTALAAIPVITRCAGHFGWTSEWASLLTAVRDHPAPDVRRNAHTVYRVPE